MICFIVIGRNEGKRLVRCIESIVKTVKENTIVNYEIIYVDSNSTDKSIEFVSQFQEVKIFKITSRSNPAIARNIGAKESLSDILCFIDGDMEIEPTFFKEVLDEKFNLKYEFVSGLYENIYYNHQGEFIRRELYKRVHSGKDKYQVTTGGLFIIKKELWNKAGGMRVFFKTGEDLDLGLRLSKMGFKLLRKNNLFALHHTIDYYDNKRMWKTVFDERFARALLYRLNFFNIHMYKKLVKSDGTILILLLTGFLSVIISPKMLLLYPIIVIVALILNQKYRRFIDFISRVFLQFFRDIYVILSFLFFYPKRRISYEYTKIR